jgi:hypothetical protein
VRYSVYGVTLETDYPLAVTLPPSQDDVDVVFEVRSDPSDSTDLSAHPPIYVEGMRPDGRPNFEYWAFDDRDVVRITAAMDFHCWPDRIVCHLVEHDQRFLVEVALFGMILSLWLERRGTPTLHGSSVVIDGLAVAFLASAGSGKTSLAATSVAAGHQLLSEDLLAVAEVDGRMLAHPGYPQFRMWPAQARHFFGSAEGSQVIRPDRDKRRIAIVDRPGSFVTGPQPLARFYVPRRTGRGDSDVVITALPAREAMLTLIRHSFLPMEVVRLGLQARRLPILARLIGRVPVCTLSVPEGLEQLPRVVKAVEKDVRLADVSRTSRRGARSSGRTSRSAAERPARR